MLSVYACPDPALIGAKETHSNLTPLGNLSPTVRGAMMSTMFEQCIFEGNWIECGINWLNMQPEIVCERVCENSQKARGASLYCVRVDSGCVKLSGASRWSGNKIRGGLLQHHSAHSELVSSSFERVRFFGPVKSSTSFHPSNW
jgi:hypothetical protein